jgi:amino-acid N-acetyltransferase
MYGARIDAVSGNFITARPYGVRAGIDHQLTGEVRSVDVVAVQKNLDNHHIVILGPTGYSTTGEVFNLLAEEVAVKTATAIKADKLIFLGEQGGVPHLNKQQLLKELIPNEVDHYLDGKDLDNEMHMHLRGAADACRGGVRRAHIISYTSDGAMLQELFTRDGSGTLVSQDYYEEIRQANIDDVVGLLELLAPLEEEGILVRRERERLETEVDQFVVVERDGMIVGCSALYPIAMQRGELPAAEIACIAVHSNYRGADRGGLMLNFLEAKAKKKGIKEVFVLTTRTSHWFLDHGFEEVSVEQLPAERKQMYNFQRNSLVFRKLLQV